jgi:hypothetical protein
LIHFTTDPMTLLSISTDKSVSDTPAICEAYGCNNLAINQVNVNVGRHGIVELNLCKNCAPEFYEQKDRSVSVQDTNQDDHNHNPKVSMINGTRRRSST